MKNKAIALLAGIFFLMVTTAQVAAQKPVTPGKQVSLPVHRLVMQLSTADTLEHKGLLNNLKHLKEGWGDSVQIEVVVHGPGLDIVTKSKSTQTEAIQLMMQKGVQFVACRNTMKQKGITEKQLLPNVGVVAMGIGEIVRRQEQGWTYIKAGF